MTFFLNPAVLRDSSFSGLFTGDEYCDVERYYAAHADLAPTPLRSADALARAAAIARLDIKDESNRFGLGAFKIVGARYAVHRLGDAARRGVVCATAGNHGRAVAHVARLEGIACTVFIPAASAHDAERSTRDSRVASMRGDGAAVVEVDGTYEDAVRRAAGFGAETGAAIVSDTSWPGYARIPRWIMAGYTHIFEEAAAQWRDAPDVVVVQAGVGGLVGAAASWFARRFGAARPFFIACEPDDAACLMASARAGHPVTLAAELRTIMAGLRCAEPSPAAWPAIAAGVDAFVSVPDAWTLEAIDRLRGERPAIDAGPSGACGVAALLALARSPDLEPVRSACGLDRSTRALAIVTEGP